MKTTSVINTLCEGTGTEPSDWEEQDGPESRCGLDYWFVNKHTGQTAYVNDDQGHITWEVSDPDDSSA
jgi:hypothetical protein